ncbi:hypothetical protein ACVNF4_23430, partial [Streptomyces sp. S6]
RRAPGTSFGRADSPGACPVEPARQPEDGDAARLGRRPPPPQEPWLADRVPAWPRWPAPDNPAFETSGHQTSS